MTEPAPTRPDHAFPVTLAWSAAAAIAWGLAWPPAALWPLAPVAVGLLAWTALRARTARGAAVAIAVTHVALGFWLYRWLAPITVLGYPFFTIYMAIQPVVFALILRRIRRSRRFGAMPLVLVVAVVNTGLEFVRGDLFMDGFPWFLLAHPFGVVPIAIQTADLLGTYFVSFVAALVAGAVAQALLEGRRAWRGAAAAAAVVCAALGYGAWRAGQSPAGAAGPAVLVIQTNLPLDNKIRWTEEEQVEDFVDWVGQTVRAADEAAAAGRAIDLVAWPETTLPGLGLEPESVAFTLRHGYYPGDYFSAGIALLSEHVGAPVLVGSPAYLGLGTEGEERRWTWTSRYNSAYLVTPGDPPPFQRYDKVFLTPFGETMPWISAWPWLEERLLALGATGMSFQLDTARAITLIELETDRGRWTIGTPICYEDTVPSVCREMVYGGGAKRVDLLVNLSNDGWFGRSDDARRLHASTARFRCVENRVPMIRVANTGMSVAYDGSGFLRESIGPGRYGEGRRADSILVQLPLDPRRSLYGSVGDAWGWLMLAATLAMALLAGRPLRGASGDSG